MLNIRLENNYIDKTVKCFAVYNCSHEEYMSIINNFKVLDIWGMRSSQYTNIEDSLEPFDFYITLTFDQALLFKLTFNIANA